VSDCGPYSRRRVHARVHRLLRHRFDPFDQRCQLAAESVIVAEATPEGASKNADVTPLAVRDQGQAESALFGEEGVLESLRAGTR
jgi:3-hydroxyisobutyrate dehydrogenase-like beta-hydroxyacid dehydrogenase